MSNEPEISFNVDDWGGPYVQAATFCDQVVQGNDGVLTPVRLVDRFVATIIGTEPSMAAPPEFHGTLLIMLKSGSAQGTHQLTVTMEPPSGLKSSTPQVDVTLFFEGNERGANVLFQTNMQFEEEGLYWFDVSFDQRLLTRVPLRVIIQRQRVMADVS